MKKLFYIVLVIVILMVIGRFVKDGVKTEQQPAAENAVVVEENAAAVEEQPTLDSNATENADGQVAVEEDVTAAEVNQNGNVTEEAVEEVEEVNPAATQDEDETIVKE